MDREAALTLTDPFVVYLDEDEIGLDGYPYPWHKNSVLVPGESAPSCRRLFHPNSEEKLFPPIKDIVRWQAGNRCVRCGHPYEKGVGEWSPCDEHCTHGGPIRREAFESGYGPAEAQWRILTVHHLNGIKHDCRWWNLVALCQRCHLRIQAKVHMERRWTREHSDWFKPYVAGYYAWVFLGRDLSREEVMNQLEALLDLEHRQQTLDL